MSKRSAHGTHVWVRTELIEAILHHQGSLPKNWKPSAANNGNVSRKNGSVKVTDWGWARATITGTVSPDASPGRAMAHDDNGKDRNDNPFGNVRLRKTERNSPAPKKRLNNNSSDENSDGVPKLVTATFVIDDEEFAPPHLLHTPVSLTYDAKDKSIVCMANSWWYANSGSKASQEPPEDLTNLSHLHEPAVVFCLKRRYEQDEIYTYTGKVLLALNPFRPVQKAYSHETMQKYWNRGYGVRPPPHVYAIAEDAYRSLVRSLFQQQNASPGHLVKGQDQSILVSGESGAGKTVTTKIVMRYLTTLSQQSDKTNNHRGGASSGGNSIEAQVLQSNPILESFGNARTLRNDNSSRFGKFIEIKFNTLGCVTSASITTYLLEKVRLIVQTPGERNYHVFYEILAGVTQRERQQLRIGNLSAQDFRMTAASGTFDRRDGVGDRETFKELRDALDTVGFTRDEQFDLLTVACALLHASNLSFQEHTPDASEIDLSNAFLRPAADLLGVSVMALNEACCRSAIEARGETLYKNLSIPQARKAVEALIKATYQAMFTYIVRKINSFITVQRSSSAVYTESNNNATASIGVLDIFGFESFEENSFEQLCINFCNEALQQQFNKFVFKHQQEEYKREGIDWSFISFPDNQDVLDLIEKRHDGVLSLLDEQCRLQRCTDGSFARSLYEKCSNHPRFSASKSQQVNLTFSIFHYAGLVEYSAPGFLEKNKDELPKETTDLLLNSSYQFVVKLAGILSETTNSKSPSQQQHRNGSYSRTNSSSLHRESVGSQFSTQLRDLRSRIAETSPHYVRCLKPNDDLIPFNFQALVIADQLRCAGVLEAIRVSRVGFPHKFLHHDFINMYSLLVRSEIQVHAKTSEGRELCELLVQFLVPDIQSVIAEEDNHGKDDSSKRNSDENRTKFLGLQIGRSQVFIRPKAFEALELMRSRKIERAAIRIQSAARMFISTIRYEIFQIATIIIQTAIRRFIGVRRVWKLRCFLRARCIQNFWRRSYAQRRFHAASVIARMCQCAFRGALARERCVLVLLEKRAITIQRSWRRSQRQGGPKMFYNLRSAVICLQTAYRRTAAIAVYKRLKAEARDLACVARERDKLREETRRLREELERAKLRNEIPGTISKEAEVKQLKNEVKKLRAELEKAKQMAVSPTLSHANELGFLAQECELKELKLDDLRRDLRQQYGFSPISSKDSISMAGHSFNDEMKFSEVNQPVRGSPGRSSSSLLDSDRLDQSFEVNMNGSQDDSASNQQTLTTMSCSYSINTPDLRGEAFFRELRRLHDAIREDNVNLVQDIFNDSNEECHVLINEGDEIGRTALHVSVLTASLAMTQTLLKRGAIANAQDNDGETPLHLAESAEMTELLLKDGRANPNIPNIDGICALHLAVQRRDLDSVRVLLLHNANVNSADNVRWFIPLHLVALPARAGVEEALGESAVRNRIAELMAGGITSRYSPDLNYQDSEGNCPLHYAVQLVTRDAFDLVKIFLGYGADPKVLNNRSQSALHLVCHNATLRKFDFFPELLRMILRHGADPNQQSAAGCTALHLSLYHRDVDSAVELVASGAQLHPLWKKPKRWVSFWDDRGSSGVLALDMVKSERQLGQILSAITTPQKWAPSRSWCMHCKNTLGTFARALHCRHCGRFVCGDCSRRTLTNDHFPNAFEVDESAWVCILCENILVTRKELGCNSTAASPRSFDECSSTHLSSSIRDDQSGDLLEF